MGPESRSSSSGRPPRATSATRRPGASAKPTKGTRNSAKVNDPKLDQMIEKQTTLGRNPEERKKLLLDIQRYIIDQAYMHNRHSYEQPVAYQPYVRDFQAGGQITSEPDRYTSAWFDK